MNEQAAQILFSLVRRYGNSVALDPLRCEGLLRDTCPRCRREIFVLVNAIRQQVPADLIEPRHTLPPELFRGFLVKRLQDELAFSEEAARWAVGTWAAAVGTDNNGGPREEGASQEGRMQEAGVAFPDNGTVRTLPEQRAAWAADLETGSTGTRLAAIREMARIPDHESVRLLIAGFEIPDWRAREAAFDALVAIGEPAVPALAEALSDTHERVVISSVIALGAIRSRLAVEPLAALLETGSEAGIYAAWALGEIGDSRAITSLTKLLKCSIPRLRTTAEEALRKFS